MVHDLHPARRGRLRCRPVPHRLGCDRAGGRGGSSTGAGVCVEVTPGPSSGNGVLGRAQRSEYKKSGARRRFGVSICALPCWFFHFLPFPLGYLNPTGGDLARSSWPDWIGVTHERRCFTSLTWPPRLRCPSGGTIHRQCAGWANVSFQFSIVFRFVRFGHHIYRESGRDAGQQVCACGCG